LPTPARQKRAVKLAACHFEKLLREGAIHRDDVITTVGDLEKVQEKMDDAFIDGSSQLQKVLSPEEWGALPRAVTAQAR
jgi:hypothetical protein